MSDSTIYAREGIKISDVCLLNPPSSWLNNLKFRIVIKYDSETRTSTETQAFINGDLGNNCVIWNESFDFVGDITNDTLLTFTAIRVHRYTPDNTIGSCKRQVIDLLGIQSSSGSWKLDITGKCQLTFKIEKLFDDVSEMVEEASAASVNLPNLELLAEASNLIDFATQVYKDQDETWSSFLLQFQVFMKAIDDISEISPYVKIAWSILSVIPKTIIAQKNRNAKVKQLCIKLKDIYDYITDAKRLPKLTATQSTTLSVLVQQTIECAYFIKAYSTENIVKNTIKGISGSIDSQIQAFNNKLDHLMKVMTNSVILETTIVTLRVSEKINELNGSTLLNDMPYGSKAGFLPKKQCLPGTRQTLINEISEWVNNDASPQILVLSGEAGTGKSAVSHTIAGIFQKQNRLGSMFCFDRGDMDRRNCLFSTISRDLADSDTLWREELVNSVNKSAVRKSEDVETQFNELIVKPSKNVATIGSVVIVVDALDESGDRNERTEILGFLLDKWSELPKNYRIIITTRPEPDIELRCQNPNVLCKRMKDIDAEETHRDIQAYVSRHLAPISADLDKIDGNWRSILAERSEGLFQWAQTACRFIDTTVTNQALLEENWKTCVSSSSLSLYGLYHRIISSQPESQNPTFKSKFKTIVGAIITARKPLSINALRDIFCYIKDIRSILIPFSSLFVGVHDPSTPVRPLHTSLFDFFMTRKTPEKINKIPEKENEYYIDTSDQSLITFACLKLMNRMLRFNICHLETSHLRNREVPNFNLRVKKAIPSHLSYSCRFWAFHLKSSAHREELVREIRKFLDYNLLYFFEVLSLLTAIDQGCVSMRELVNWCTDGGSSGLAADAMDAWDFGYDFGEVMMESTPHLYISALPFVPHDSFVSKQYLETYPGRFTFDIGEPVGSSRKIGITQKHDFGYSTALAFSPKGRYVASGSSEGEFWVWNYITGEQLMRGIRSKAGKGRNHINTVYDIVFSPDGELAYCCFRDGDILVWNTKTNKASMEQYGPIIGTRCDFCIISSDGCFIIWRTEKGALLFDRRNHRIIDQFDGDGLSIYGDRLSIPVAVFSPNGDRLALYRDSEPEVYIWNTREQTRHVVYRGSMRDMILTNNYIALQKDSTSIEIRDVRRANTKVAEIQHETYVHRLHFSPDNQYILSSSTNVYSIWSVSTGELIGRSFVDNFTRCLGFSHDSKSIALGTSDGSINVRQWDKSVELSRPHDEEIRRVDAIWLRGTYLILRYVTKILGRAHLQISNITTTNTIVLEVKLGDRRLVRVFPDEENVRVAYVTSRGLCLWNEKEGRIVVDGLGHSVTALACSDKYFISGDNKGIINIWDSCTHKLIHGPITLPQAKSVRTILVPATGTRFVVGYLDGVEIRDCGSGGIVGGPFMSRRASLFRPVAFAANDTHVICMSKNSVDILSLDALTGERVSSMPFSCDNPEWQLSLNGKYLTWIDNNKMKLLDADTETLFNGPSLNQPVKKSWFSNDSNLIITASSANVPGNIASLDIWDIQSEKTIIKTIRYPFKPEVIDTLALSNRRLVDSIKESSQCSVWDLDTYEMMSTLYNSPSRAAKGPDIEGTPASKKTELLDYALTAWKKASLPAFAKMDNGWVLGLHGELLFWVPEKKRKQFWFPCMMHVPHRNVTKLNFNNFVHGTRWKECRKCTSM